MKGIDKIKLKALYIQNKERDVGKVCYCPICQTRFIKKTKDQVFCNKTTKCKDAYHNFMRYGTSYSFGIFASHSSIDNENTYIESSIKEEKKKNVKENKFDKKLLLL